MKIKFLISSVVLFVLALLSPVAHAQSPGQPDPLYNVLRFTGIPASMPTQSVSNSFTSSVFTLLPDKPFSLWTSIGGTNAGSVSNVIVTLQLGYDATGTNFATTPTLTATVAGLGTNPVVQLDVFNTNQLRGARTIRVYQVSNTNIYTVPLRIVGGQQRLN